MVPMKIHAPASEPLVLNGPQFPVTAGAAFTAKFSWHIPDEANSTGFAALIFGGPDGTEVARTVRNIRTTWT